MGSLSKWRTFFPVTLQFSRTLSKWRINHQKVRHFDKGPIIPEFSKWRTFIGRSYQNGELFEFEILVARSSLLVICKLKQLDVLRQLKPLYDIFVRNEYFFIIRLVWGKSTPEKPIVIRISRYF